MPLNEDSLSNVLTMKSQGPSRISEQIWKRPYEGSEEAETTRPGKMWVRKAGNVLLLVLLGGSVVPRRGKLLHGEAMFERGIDWKIQSACLRMQTFTKDEGVSCARQKCLAFLS